MSIKNPVIADLISGSVVSGLFLSFVPGLLYDAGFQSPVQFAGILLAQKLLLSVSKGTAESAARAHLIGLMASIVVIFNITFSKHPSELAFVVLALFSWASSMFFPAKRSSSRNVIMKIGKEEFDLVQTILTFGTPLLASAVFLIGGKMAIGLATVAVMLFNAQGIVSLSDISTFRDMVKSLNKDQAFAIVCWMVRKAFVEGLTPVYFPGYYFLAFGIETSYLGFVSAGMMVALTLRRVVYDMIPDIERMMKDGIMVFIGLCGLLVSLDMLFRTSLVVHLCLTYPLLCFLKFVNQHQMEEFNKHAEWAKWIDIPSEVLCCFSTALFYSVFPFTRGISLNGIGCAAAFALFIPQVREQVGSGLVQLVKQSKTIPPLQSTPGSMKINTPPPLPPKPSKFD
jgi:hypothetical protein